MNPLKATRGRRDQAMNEAEKEIKQRDKTIAENESDRQTISSIRISTWAIAVAVVIGLIVFGWVLLR
jgi:F0F1-type ATP synthase assembly protein I